MAFSIKIRGDKRLMAKLERAGSLKRPMREAVDLLLKEVSRYPASNSRYRRTGSLARSWRRMPNGVSTKNRYANFVMGHKQTETFRKKGWRTTARILKDIGPRVLNLYQSTIRKALSS